MTNESTLYTWCLEQAAARYMEKLSQSQIEKLNSIDFPWKMYEEKLDELGFDWVKNSPRGVGHND